jgi:hypothetical protein
LIFGIPYLGFRISKLSAFGGIRESFYFHPEIRLWRWATTSPGRRVAGIHRYEYREMTAARFIRRSFSEGGTPPRLTKSVKIRVNPWLKNREICD